MTCCIVLEARNLLSVDSEPNLDDAGFDAGFMQQLTETIEMLEDNTLQVTSLDVYMHAYEYIYMYMYSVSIHINYIVLHDRIS